MKMQTCRTSSLKIAASACDYYNYTAALTPTIKWYSVTHATRGIILNVS